MLNFGAAYVYDLYANPRLPRRRRHRPQFPRPMLVHLRAGDPDEAAFEMEKHLRVLRFMRRLAASPDRASA